MSKKKSRTSSSKPSIKWLYYLSIDQEELKRALIHCKAQELKSAEQIIESIITQQPKLAEAWQMLGLICSIRQQWNQAIAYYQKALTFNPQLIEAHYNLALTLMQVKKLHNAKQHQIMAIRLLKQQAIIYHDNDEIDQEEELCYIILQIAPQDPGAWNGLAWVAFNRHNIEESIRYAQKAVSYNPNFAAAQFHLAKCYLISGNYPRGWEQYEWRWKHPEVLRKNIVLPPYTPWDPNQDIKGRSLLVYGEQGFGDCIQFIRFLGWLQKTGAKIILSVRQPLVRLFKTLSLTQPIKIVSDLDFNQEVIDYQVPLLSLPKHLNITLDDIPTSPYLSVPVDCSYQLPTKKNCLKVGIFWSILADHSGSKERTCSFNQFLRLLSIPNIQFFSLQRDIPPSDLVLLEKHSDQIIDLSSRLTDFGETANIIQQLDLVITVDTAVAHLAGALSKPAWVLLPYMCDWRWLLDRTDTPWYPSVKLFRQDKPYDWESVMTQVISTLKTLIPTANHLKKLEKFPYGHLLYPIDSSITQEIDRVGTYRSWEISFLKQVLKVGDTIIEVGSNIGEQTIILALGIGPSGTLIGVEGDRLSFQNLCANLSLNNITNTYAYYELDSLDKLNLSKCNLIKINLPDQAIQIIRESLQTINQHQPIIYLRWEDRINNITQLMTVLNDIKYRSYFHRRDQEQNCILSLPYNHQYNLQNFEPISESNPSN